jgi:tripartite-type tricarboxylate transporter receptor subunit TctC
MPHSIRSHHRPAASPARSPSPAVRGTIALAAAALCTVSAGALAQAGAGGYPDRAIRLIVPFPPGGSTDGAARVIGQKLTDLWGQQILIDNRPGASGVVGSEIAARANPDGYTLLFGTIGSHAVNVSLFKLSYDPLRDFEPITMTAAVGNVLVVNAKSPIRSVKELVAAARAKPASITFASSGIGGAPHLTGELFALQAGIKLVHVPYKGGGPAMADLVGGNVSMSFASMTASLPFIKDGRLRALAVASGRRARQLPDVPTVAESGFTGFEVRDWQGLFAPRATPQPIVAKLADTVRGLLRQDDTQERFAQLGLEVVASSPAEFRKDIAAEIARWARVVKDANIRAE